MLKIPTLSKLCVCLLFWLSLAQSMPVSAQDDGDGSAEEFDRGGRFGGGWRDRGFRGRGGFRDNDSEGGGFRGGEGNRNRDWGNRDWGGGGGRWGGRGGFDSGDDESMPSSENGARTSVSRPRVTVEIPSAFVDGDRDGDGQIGLYEWRQWRRGDMAGFLALDHNGDGYLTPSELVKGPRTPSHPAMAGLSLVSTDASPSAGASSNPAAASTNSPETSRANNMFRMLDSNHNGQLDPEEWGRAKTTRALFDAAKIDLNTAMPKEDFIRQFVELSKNR